MRKILYPWLVIIALLHVILGLAVIYLAKSDIINPYLSELSLAFDLTIDSQSETLIRTILQLFGPTIASWGILFFIGLNQYRNNGQPITKLLLIIALLTWFLLDTTISAYFNIYSHVYLNTVAFVVIVIPLIFLRPNRPKSNYSSW